MASKYIEHINPFLDYLLELLIDDVDLTDNRNKSEVFVMFIIILENILNNQKDSIYLDFEIIGDKNNIKLVGNNAISALWLSGIFPKNIATVISSNTIIIDNFRYSFNIKTKKLTRKQI